MSRKANKSRRKINKTRRKYNKSKRKIGKKTGGDLGLTLASGVGVGAVALAAKKRIQNLDPRKTAGKKYTELYVPFLMNDNTLKHLESYLGTRFNFFNQFLDGNTSELLQPLSSHIYSFGVHSDSVSVFKKHVVNMAHSDLFTVSINLIIMLEWATDPKFREVKLLENPKVLVVRRSRVIRGKKNVKEVEVSDINIRDKMNMLNFKGLLSLFNKYRMMETDKLDDNKSMLYNILLFLIELRDKMIDFARLAKLEHEGNPCATYLLWFPPPTSQSVEEGGDGNDDDTS